MSSAGSLPPLSFRGQHLIDPTKTSDETSSFACAMFVIASIAVMGMAVAGTGAAAYFHAGVLNHVSDTTSISMMAIGGGVALTFATVVLISSCLFCGSCDDEKTPVPPPSVIEPPPVSSAEEEPTVPVKVTVTVEPTEPVPTYHSFGKEDWKTHFGVDVEDAPLPQDIEAILDSTCPFFGENKKVRDTHMLVLIPATVNDKAFTLEAMKELMTPGQCGFINSHIKEAQPVSKSYWVLMTKEIIPGSSSKTYAEQKKLIQRMGNDYVVPRVLETVTAIAMIHAVTGEKLFPQTCTGCEEERVAVGNFGAKGFDVRFGLLEANHNRGIAAVRRF